MVDNICNFVINLFGSQAWIAIIIIAFLPVVELRGAIPIAFGMMPWWQAYIFSVIGSTLPALFVVPLLVPFFAWLKKRRWARSIALHFETKFQKKSQGITSDANKTEGKKRDLVKFFGVFCFVAVPLPLTGAWTGSAVAAYVKLDYKKSLLAILLGNIVSGGIMTALCSIWKGYESVILAGFLVLVIVVVLVLVVIKLLKKAKLVEEMGGEAQRFIKLEANVFDRLKSGKSLYFVCRLDDIVKDIKVGDELQFEIRSEHEKSDGTQSEVVQNKKFVAYAEDVKNYDNVETLVADIGAKNLGRGNEKTEDVAESIKMEIGDIAGGVIAIKLKK